MRHGESVTNFEERITGHLDAELTDKGRAQAVKAGEGLKDLTIDTIVSSPLIRTKETAQLVAEQIGYPNEAIIIEPLAIERYLGTFEGMLKSEAFPLTDEKVEAAGGEDEEAMYKRANELLDHLRETGSDNILLVCHNGFGKRLRAVIDHTEDQSAWELPDFPNAGVYDLGEI